MSDQAEATTDAATAEVSSIEEDLTGVTMEQISQLMILQKLDALRTDFRGKGMELRKRQERVRWLHDLLQRINKRVDKETGELDLTHSSIDEKTGKVKEGVSLDDDKELQDVIRLRELLQQAADDKGYEITAKSKYNKDERERMTDNLRMVCDDLNLQNDMQLQDLNQLVNERYEVYQMARAIMKPLHEDKVHKARSLSGR